MAIKKELIITITPEGELTIKTEGFKGAECEEEVKPLERSLGVVKNRKRTSEYYQKENEFQKNKTTK